MTTHVFSSLIDNRDHTIASQVSRRLRDAIVLGELRPGARINLSQLSRQLRVSGTPLREALSRLIAEDLVEFEDNRGYRVSNLTSVKLVEVSSLRSEIEPIALQYSIEAAKVEWENLVIATRHRLGLLRRVGSASALELCIAALKIHKALISDCPSLQLASFLEGLQNQHLRYLYASHDPIAPPFEALDKAVAMALDRDIDAAKSSLKSSLWSFGNAVDRSYSGRIDNARSD